jgi:RNA polymerase sigma-70 factor, ECF subfamily
LPERYRVAVVLRHISGLGYREMAQALGQPEGTIKANVHRGLALLREALERRAEPVGGRR